MQPHCKRGERWSLQLSEPDRLAATTAAQLDQSELPYDPPNQGAWQHDGIDGYASYKVGDGVTSHDAWGVGVYSAFRQAVVAETAIEAPVHPAVGFHHAQTVFLNGDAASGINHILNATGAAVTTDNRRALLD